MKIKDMLYALWTQTHEDTGWNHLVTNQLMYRYKNGIVYVMLENYPKPTAPLIGTLPEGYRPSRNIAANLRTNEASAVTCWVEPNGAIKVDSGNIPSSVSNIAGTFAFPVN